MRIPLATLGHGNRASCLPTASTNRSPPKYQARCGAHKSNAHPGLSYASFCWRGNQRQHRRRGTQHSSFTRTGCHELPSCWASQERQDTLCSPLDQPSLSSVRTTRICLYSLILTQLSCSSCRQWADMAQRMPSLGPFHAPTSRGWVLLPLSATCGSSLPCAERPCWWYDRHDGSVLNAFASWPLAVGLSSTRTLLVMRSSAAMPRNTPYSSEQQKEQEKA